MLTALGASLSAIHSMLKPLARMRQGRVSNFVFKAGFERSRPCPERGSATPIRADAAPPVPHADRRKPAFGIVFLWIGARGIQLY